MTQLPENTQLTGSPEEWQTGVRHAQEWARQATSLVSSPPSQASQTERLAAEKAVETAKLATEAVSAPDRIKAARTAEFGAVVAKTFIHDLEGGITRARAAGASDAADFMRMEANTWQRALLVAEELRRLAGPDPQASKSEPKTAMKKKHFWQKP